MLAPVPRVRGGAASLPWDLSTLVLVWMNDRLVGPNICTGVSLLDVRWFRAGMDWSATSYVA